MAGVGGKCSHGKAMHKCPLVVKRSKERYGRAVMPNVVQLATRVFALMEGGSLNTWIVN